MNRLNFRYTIILLLIASSIDPLLARTFRDQNGKEFEANIMSVSGDTVNLMIPGKTKIYKFSISKLSDADQDYIKDLKNNKARQKPSKTAVNKPKEKTVEVKQKKRRSHTEEIIEKYRLVENYQTNWPRLVSVSATTDVKAVTEDKAKQRYVYHSANYEFICDVKLTKTVVKKFASFMARILCKRLS